VERHLGELTRQLPAAGRPKKPGSGPDPIDPNKSACITFSDLCTGVLKWVVDVHPFEINERKLARPIDLFLEGLDACPAPTLIDNATSLDVIAGLHASATVDHSGLVHKWIRYTSDDLAWMRKEVGAKFKTTIKYNPYDLGSVFVLHPRSGMWIQVEARDHEYASGLTATQHKLIRNAATDKLTEKNAETVLRRTRLELQDHWARAIKGGRKLKRGSRELALFQGVSSLSRIYAPQLNASVRATALAADSDSTEPTIGSIPTFDVFMRDER
jgi:putative transposase